MVLIRTLLVLSVLAALAGGAGCGQSLFDANGDRRDGGGDDDGPPVPETCPDMCLGDAAADFDASSSFWRYLEEVTSRQWMPMGLVGAERIGSIDPGNKIAQCKGSSAPACQALPSGLLVTPAGQSAEQVPALEFEFRATEAQVLHLSLRAHVPKDGGEQNIRLYRNSAEDVLFTAPGVKDATIERDVIVDALPGDRFLLAVEPVGLVGGSAALEFFVSNRGESFPQTCELAASFETASGSVVPDLCKKGRALTFKVGPMGMDTSPMFIDAGVFPEQRRAINIPIGYYFRAAGNPILRGSSPQTVQFWARVNSVSASEDGWAFSDFDVDLGGGSGVSFTSVAAPQIQVQGAARVTGGVITGVESAPFSIGPWRFVRMIVTDSKITWCVDGKPMPDLPLASDRPEAQYPVSLGIREAQTMAQFDGALDDVRVFSTALPCP